MSIASPATRRFARHYVEMCIAMLLGMAVLGTIALAALGGVGVSASDLERDAPAALLFGMALTMTGPMVWWMRRRGHAWQPSAEMGASMIVPTAVVVALLPAEIVTDVGTLLGIQHVAMFPAMLVAMLLRRDEYTGTHAHA